MGGVSFKSDVQSVVFGRHPRIHYYKNLCGIALWSTGEFIPIEIELERLYD